DRLAAGQFEFAVEARHHGMVPIAVNAKAEVREAQLFVELGVSTASHIEIEMVLGLTDDPDILTAAAGPKLLGHFSQCRGGSSVGRSPSCAVLGRELANGLVDDLARCV